MTIKKRVERATERQERPRPGVERCYPGEQSLRFRAALAGARLARHLRREGKQLADTVAQFFARDGRNHSADVASYVTADQAQYGSAADERIPALRAHRKRYWAHIGKAIAKARDEYERGTPRARRAA
jgi:hypothetical protein